MRAMWVAMSLVTVRVAYAEPDEPKTDPTTSLFEEGRALLDAGKPAEACAKFAEALTLAPDQLGIMLNLGLCHEQQDHVASALVWFRRTQARASEQGQPDAEAAAKQRATTLATKVPTIAVVVTSTLGPASVTVDGVAIPEIDRKRVEVDAGHHVIEASAGAIHDREELDIADGEARRIPIVLAPPAPPPPPPPAPAVSHLRSYELIGGGALLIGGSVALGLVGRSHYDDTDHLSTRDAWRDGVRWGGTSLFVVGAAAAGYGAWMRFHPRAKKEHMVVTPAASRDAIGLAVGGAF